LTPDEFLDKMIDLRFMLDYLQNRNYTNVPRVFNLLFESHRITYRILDSEQIQARQVDRAVKRMMNSNSATQFLDYTDLWKLRR
jgi:hypothetical protein